MNTDTWHTNIFLAALFSVGIAGCSTALTPAGAKISLATASQKEHCKSLGVVVGAQKSGPDKAASAMNSALNQVAERGGDSFFVVGSSTDWAEGSSVTGEALRCASAQ